MAQDQAFATNEEEAFLFEIDLEEREVASTVNMTLDSAAYPCARWVGCLFVVCACCTFFFDVCVAPAPYLLLAHALTLFSIQRGSCA